MRIEKKIWPEYFQKIIDGVKTFELRLADFECRPGDILVLREWDPRTKEYTGRVIEKKVTYVAKSKDMRSWPDEDIRKYGFLVIGFK
ncbi:RNA-binding protein [Candidatus Micrarchaeota archaeon]|nr:MAG: RNA-binding protein [Candidatus Micrarchaeota archaeon]